MGEQQQRYSNGIASSSSAKQEASGASSSDNVDPLLRSSLDRPPYHPQMGIVMTDEQWNLLKGQISIYGSICRKLIEMHQASLQPAQQQASPQKFTRRKRWMPTEAQLKVLHKYQELGSTPNKQKVREITAELSVHGSVNESSVYNWFQNRKRRRDGSGESLKEETGDKQNGPPSALNPAGPERAVNTVASSFMNGEPCIMTEVDTSDVKNTPSGTERVKVFARRSMLPSVCGTVLPHLNGEEEKGTC